GPLPACPGNWKRRFSTGLAVLLQFGAAFKVVRILTRNPLFQTPSQNWITLRGADEMGISSAYRRVFRERLSRRAEEIADMGAVVFGPLPRPVIVDASSEQVLLDQDVVGNGRAEPSPSGLVCRMLDHTYRRLGVIAEEVHRIAA